VDEVCGWDEVAPAYAEKFGRELDVKPFDRKAIEWLAERAGPIGPICDLGCGPGQVAVFLHSLGYDTSGIDLSPEMVRRAQASSPDIEFEVGDMCDLSRIATGAFGGVAAFYSIVNIAPDQLPHAFAEMHRVLEPGGWLLVSFHIGEGVRRVDEFLGERVRLDFYFFQPVQVQSLLGDAGFEVVEIIQRGPYAESVEAQTDRAYIFATASGTST
jgi:SAM-dependent methyltransferase